MKILKYPFFIVWRIWFYCWVLFTIIPVFPFLLLITSTEKWYPVFYKVARAWANTILFVMGFKISFDEEHKVEKGKSYVFIANHTSMIDLMVMLSVVKNPAVFVGKKELTKIPVFGFFFKRTSIVVNRSCENSRKEVYIYAQKKINRGYSICIFPEGLVPDDESVILSEFKNGAFRLAIEHQIPIVPMVFYDCKKYFSYTFFSGSSGTLRVKVFPFINTKGLELKHMETLKNDTFEFIFREILKDIEISKSEKEI